jgi:hypothetical protein
MKALKISLAIIVVAIIAFFVIQSLDICNDEVITNTQVPTNPFIERIDKKIISISTLPDSKLSKDEYKNVMYYINSLHKPHPPKYPYGRLGNTKKENDLQKENFIYKLYTAYSKKFISQAFYVFGHSEWNSNDLSFIRNEYQKLQNSSLLEKDSDVDKDFKKIKIIFDKYDEIVLFIKNCKNYSFKQYGLFDIFPISDVQDTISRADKFRRNDLGNEFVNHCTRLHNELKAIPQVLFREHIRYFDVKISRWSNKHRNFNSLDDYINNLWQPMQDEIGTLSNSLYNAPNFNNEKNKLLKKWENDRNRAHRIFR